MSWNYGDILDAIPAALPPGTPALIHGDRILTWDETSRRSNNLARYLTENGVAVGDKVAFYMRNRPEYIEGLAACFKGRFVHANINYRYRANEAFYILDNSDARVVIYGSEFADVIAELKDRLSQVLLFIEVGEQSDCLPFALRFEDLVTVGDGAALDVERSGDDLLFVYTGGTTGMPRAVMWTHHECREAFLMALRALGDPIAAAPSLRALVETIGELGPGPCLLPACPLMHATGLISAIGNMMSGGCIVTLPDPTFDAASLWDAVEHRRVNSLIIVGDAFAKPMLEELDRHPGSRALASVRTILSSGAMWSAGVKSGLLSHLPDAAMVDQFGASEGMGFGSAVTTSAGEIDTASFKVGARCVVLDEDGTAIDPGSGIAGIIALRGPLPLGYYKDPEKTAATFRSINGERYSVPGDWCVVEADGSLKLLGRGSTSINTAGEKVHPEEVEETLKTHPAVRDALVIGVPDPKWGQAVTAVVEIADGAVFDETDLRQHVRDSLAGYKTPKRVLLADRALRAPNGKPDYSAANECAKAAGSVADTSPDRVAAGVR